MEEQQIIRGVKRAAQIVPGQFNDAEQTFDMTFISGFSGINYWSGIGLVHEIIEVTPDSVDLSWVNSGNAPLCLEHDTTQVVGNIISGEIVQRDGSYVGAARGRISPNTPETVALYKDIVGGYRTNISASYDILSYVSMGTDDAGYPILKAVRLKITEISSVGLPFDPTIGTNRSDKTEQINKQTEQVKKMENEVKNEVVDVWRS